MRQLDKIRKKIDLLDKKIIPLLEKRLALCLKTKKYKTGITDKNRENEILNNIDREAVKEIYKAVFKAAKKIQKTTFEKKNCPSL